MGSLTTRGTVSDDKRDELTTLAHQGRMLDAPYLYGDRDFFFMIAGYNGGKSFTGELTAQDLFVRYEGHYINVGIGGTSIVMLRRTLVGDLIRYLQMYRIPFSQNKNENTITIGTVRFTLIGTENPDTIYAHRFHVFLCDELDELPQQKARDAFIAIQERTREPLPDGRRAWSAFYTTAQGYRGTYQIIEEMKDRARLSMQLGKPVKRSDRAYVLHASTYDNRYADPEWIERMEGLYNEVERRVYLGGEFANLLTGRVYYGYDEAKHRLKARPFEPQPDDQIKIGQDLNAGYSRGVAIVKRTWNGKPTLFAVKTWSFGQIGHAPRLIRNDFPAQEIIECPDASGKEVLEGYAQEFQAEDIRWDFSSVNPSIVDRIFVENKLFEAGQLYLFPECGDLSMALKVRQYDEKGDPVKRQGENDPSHYCFAAGTMVLTDKGNKSIESIRPGDQVLTRKGFRSVLLAGMTGIKEVGHYAGLTCTADHPIFVGEWKAAGLWTQSDMLCRIEDREAKQCILLKSYLKDRFSKGDLMQEILPIKSTIAGMVEMASGFYTGRSGVTSMVRYLLVMIFIISTATLSTTIHRIFGRYRTASIGSGMESIFQKWLQRSLLRTCQKPVRRQRRGIAVQKVLHGIRNMASLLSEGFLNFSASIAGMISILSCAMRSSVVGLAFQETGESRQRTGSLEPVYSAIDNSGSTSMRRQNVAVDRAPHICVPVYNLTIEGEHEYFANGILVSNCDGFEYVLWRIVAWDPDFRDFYLATRTGRAEQKNPKPRRRIVTASPFTGQK